MVQLLDMLSVEDYTVGIRGASIYKAVANVCKLQGVEH